MIYTTFQNISLLGFLGFAPFEKDPEFREETLKLSRQGMLVAGALGMVAVLVYVFAKVCFVNANISWTYRGIDLDSIVVLWDKLIFMMLSTTAVVLAFTRNGPRWGRLLMSAMIVVFCVSSMIDDVILGQGYTYTFLVLFFSIAVGTMPYRAWQTFIFGLVIMAVVSLSVFYLPIVVDVPHLKMSKTMYVFLGIITIIYTGISGLLSFQPGESIKTFTVVVTNDLILEGDETVILRLRESTGDSLITLGDATLFILDDDIHAGAVDPGFNAGAGADW